MEELKNSIWHRAKKLIALQTTAHGIMVVGQSRYSMPVDYSSDLTLVLLDGDRRGTAQGGGSDTIILAADEVANEAELLGFDVLVNSNTGVGSLSQGIGFNAGTKELTVSPSFNTAPAAGSGYLIINREFPVDMDIIQNLDRYKQLGLGRPDRAHIVGDEDYGEFILNRAPDRAYGARLRYYANLMRIDLNSTLMASLYLRWREIMTGWITYKALDWGNNDRSTMEFQKHQIRMNDLIIRETYGTDISNLNEKVVDYYG